MRVQTIISTTLGAVLLVGALVYAFQSKSGQALPAIPTHGAIVKVQVVTEAVAHREARFSAVTHPKHHAVLSFSIPARMVSRPVEIGDKVEAGQVLAALDIKQFDNAVKSEEAAVAELKIRLTQAGRDNLRYKQLNKGKAVAVSKAEQISSSFMELKAALDGAQTKLAESHRLRNEAELRAPFAGVVDKVFLEPGEWAKPGQPVLELLDARNMELEVEVPETVIGHLREGQKVDIRLPFIDNTLVPGTIGHLAKATLSSGHLFPVIITMEPNAKLIPGMTAELVVNIESPQALQVPVAAVVNPGGTRPSLFVLDGDRVREVFVSLKQFIGNRVLVTGKLTSGDRVVVSGQTILTDGKRVEVRQ